MKLLLFILFFFTPYYSIQELFYIHTASWAIKPQILITLASLKFNKTNLWDKGESGPQVIETNLSDIDTINPDSTLMWLCKPQKSS